MLIAKNNYEIRGPVTAMFIIRRDGTKYEALFDTEDLTKVLYTGGLKWRIDHQKKWGYTYIASGVKVDGKLKTIYLHRLVMDNPEGYEVDHINHITSDNRKCNLRLTTRAENAQNRRNQRNSKSGVRGVHWNKSAKKWRAAVILKSKIVWSGSFNDIKDAEKAVIEARNKYFTHHTG